MTQNREFYAETVEEAVEKASQKLGIPPEELEYEVLDTGSAGFLGIGGRDARIEASVSDDLEFSEDTESSSEEPPAPENYDEDEKSSPEAEVAANDSPDGDKEPEESSPAPKELLEEIEKFVSAATELMGLDTKVDVYDAGEFIAVDVSSAETGLFIGQKGETIDALQYLLNVSVYRERPFIKRITIDSEGYRQRRIEAVQGIAHRMARKTVREQQPVELPPMNSSERRIVHTFLKDNPKVETGSQGNGDNRRVVVSPS